MPVLHVVELKVNYSYACFLNLAEALYNHAILTLESMKHIPANHLHISPSTLDRMLLYIGATVLATAFNIQGLGLLIFVGLIPLCRYVYNLDRHSTRQRRLDFYLFGLIVAAGGNFFMMQISAANWNVMIRGWFAVAAPIIAWVMISSFCALAWLALGEVLHKIGQRRRRLLALPVLYAGAELLKSYLFAIMAYGPHGSLSPNFNWGSLAVPASGTNMVLASPYAGFFGLTVIVATINLGIFWCLRRQAWQQPRTVPVALVTAILLAFSLWPRSIANLGDKAMIDGKRIVVIGLAEKDTLANWSPEYIQERLPQNSIDLLVLPEYSGLLESTHSKQILSSLSEHGVAVTSVHTGPAPAGHNRVLFINRGGEVVDQQDKTFLIPTGETLPYSLQAVFKLMKRRDIITSFTYTQQISPGETIEEPFEYLGTSYGALACSGVGALNEYRRLSQEGADILINSASLSFLKADSTYHVYADNMARFQAFSNKKPFVQASRSGNSFILAP